MFSKRVTASPKLIVSLEKSIEADEEDELVELSEESELVEFAEEVDEDEADESVEEKLVFAEDWPTAWQADKTKAAVITRRNCCDFFMNGLWEISVTNYRLQPVVIHPYFPNFVLPISPSGGFMTF